MYLHTRSRVLGWEDVYKGSVNVAQVCIAEIFRGNFVSMKQKGLGFS
jgi:DNA repair protein RadC